MSAGAAPSRQAEALDGLLSLIESLRRSAREPVAIFDLDDTLLSTDRRHKRILREYAAQPGSKLRDARAAQKLVNVPDERLHYSVTDTARAMGVHDKETLAEIRAFWSARFFSNEYLLADHPVPGAPEYCREASGRGATVVYMTGRDEAMRGGTLAALERWGFPRPDGERARLILKPRFDMPDHEYKGEGMKKIGQWGNVAAAFENEPMHLNLFQETFPEAWHFLVETKHSGRPIEPHPSARRIKDFRRG